LVTGISTQERILARPLQFATQAWAPLGQGMSLKERGGPIRAIHDYLDLAGKSRPGQLPEDRFRIKMRTFEDHGANGET